MTNTTAPSDNPIVCTLSPAEMAEQVLEWKDLTAHALTTESIPNGVASTYPIALANAVEDLARRELSCCGTWLTIETERHDDMLRLALTTSNKEGQAMLTRMSGCSCGS